MSVPIHELTSPDPDPAAVKELEQAFQAFTRLSDQLDHSYRVLERRIQDLTGQLHDAHSARLEELAEKERLAARLSRLLTALPAGVVLINGAGVIEECNPAAVDLLGEPLQGELWREVIARAFTDDGEGQAVRLRDGRLASISTCPLGDEPGQIVLLMDVTETHALQRALAHHQRLSAMGEMAARLAHQIRTPLASAMLYGGQLQNPRLAPARRSEAVDKLLAQLKHLERVVEDMLAFARGGLEGGETFTLAAWMDDLRDACAGLLRESGGRLAVGELPEVILRGNRGALTSALENLVANGIQAGGPGSTVTLTARVLPHQAGTALELRLCDEGPGIPPELAERVFEPFFTTRERGTGLGLAVVQSVVRAHGGAVWVDGDHHPGACFVIRLPLPGSPREDNHE